MYDDTKLFINGVWRDGSDNETKPIIDPSNEETIGTLAVASDHDIADALVAAERGFDLWRNVGTWERASKLRRTADLIRARCENIASTMSLETGKPIAEAIGEINAAADQFEWYSEETKRIYGQTIEARTSDSRMSVIFQPVGVVAAFSAWNFPALLPARKIAAALGAGCSIIVKPAGEAPASCAALVQACHDAGVDAGVVNFLTGNSNRISELLLKSPIVRKVSVTGSVGIGRQILSLASEGIKKVTMELGGHAPVLVFDDFDPEKAAEICAQSKFRNCGQVCISPTRFYVHESSYEAFSQKFAEIASGLKVGRGMDDGIQVGPMANRRGIDNISSMTQDALKRGASLLAGGKAPDAQSSGFFWEPTVLGRVPDEALVMNEEPFGPIAPISTFTDYDEVIRRANSLHFGLAGYVFSNDLTTVTKSYEDLEVGMVGVNEMLLATAEAPFGGIKGSGMGREGGSLGIQDYLVPKYVKIKLER